MHTVQPGQAAGARQRYLATTAIFSYIQPMEVNFTPDVEKKLNDLAAQSGRSPNELLQDAFAAYFEDW
jgi:hypothetical protein